jgi:hypothetical protein
MILDKKDSSISVDYVAKLVNGSARNVLSSINFSATVGIKQNKRARLVPSKYV